MLIAGEINVIMLGWRRKNMITRAVKRMLAKVNSRNFNSLEISKLTSGNFLGIPYVSLSGFSRHLQENSRLLNAGERKQSRKDADWARA
jgi:hypothetical protein